jgi:uncharacterized protein YdeI (YjbR/CyaY-like superfamily)
VTDRPGDGAPVLAFASREQWAAWLGAHRDAAAGVWLKIARTGLGIDSVTYAEALDVALCHGWIDGRKERFDDRHWLQRFTPRRPRSRWSKRNRERAEALIAGGDMTAAGLAEVERARADGRWERAYDSHSTATVPDDLRRELDRNPAAAAFFATLDSANRYAVLYRIQEARRPQTRAARIERFVAMLNRGERIHP